MSASATTAQAGIGFGGFKSALAALALVVLLAVTVAVVALGVARPAAPATHANPIVAPAVLDKGSRDEMNAAPAVPYIIDRDKGAINAFGNETVPGYGGWNGPRQAGPGDLSKDDTYAPSRSGGHNGTRFAQ